MNDRVGLSVELASEENPSKYFDQSGCASSELFSSFDAEEDENKIIEEKVSVTNGTGVSLSRGGVTVSVRIAWALHQLVVLCSSLDFSFFLSSRSTADRQFRNHFE